MQKSLAYLRIEAFKKGRFLNLSFSEFSKVSKNCRNRKELFIVVLEKHTSVEGKDEFSLVLWVQRSELLLSGLTNSFL